MSNNYFDTGDYTALVEFTRARGAAINTILAAIEDGFDLLPAVAALVDLTAANVFTANQTIQLTDAGASRGPQLNLKRISSSPAANDLGGIIKAEFRDDAAATVEALTQFAQLLDPSAGSLDAQWVWQTIVDGTLANRLVLRNGLYSPSATGGDKGIDTANFSAVYDDNSLLTPYVLEAARTGRIDMAALDAKVPNAEIEAWVEFKPVTRDELQPVIELRGGKPHRVKRMVSVPVVDKLDVLDDEGNPTGEIIEVPRETKIHHPAKTIERTHGPARRFAANLDELDPAKLAEKMKANGHLPSFPSEAEWVAKGNFPTGELIRGLMEAVEVQAVHINTLRQRIDTLEAV